MIEIFGTICTIIAVAGVICNNRKLVICFYLWLVSNVISAGLHFHTGLYSLMIRDLIFLVLAVEGAIKWSRKE